MNDFAMFISHSESSINRYANQLVTMQGPHTKHNHFTFGQDNTYQLSP